MNLRCRVKRLSMQTEFDVTGQFFFLVCEREKKTFMGGCHRHRIWVLPGAHRKTGSWIAGFKTTWHEKQQFK